MKITNKTVLITGGGSGIGFEIAQLLSAQNNKVIILGRSKTKLELAVKSIPNGAFIVSDITSENDINALAEQITNEYPDLSILINNAASAFAYKLTDTNNAYSNALSEITTNYLAPIRLTEKLLPVLTKQSESAIVNVSSIVAFAPSIKTPTYSDSKAALHSYTQALRITLAENTTVKVFELMPPLVNTDFSEAIGGKENGMPAIEVAHALIEGLQNETLEIYVGQTAPFRELFFSSPQDALVALNS